MWKCPKCGRVFENTEQNHSCVKQDSIDEYIAAQAEDVQPVLQRIRETIRAAAPEATEKISWQMPTFWQGENLIHFAAFKKHIGLYPGGEATTEFADRLSGYKTSKGAIQLPLGKPIDYELITDIVLWRVGKGGLIMETEGIKSSGQQQLRDPDLSPTDEIVAKALGEAYNAYMCFVRELVDHNIQLEWRYYNDGKAWLGKGICRWTGIRGGQKETTVFWLSVWDGFFKVTIYIPEKYRADILSSLLDDKVRQLVEDSNQMGNKLKFVPLVFEMHSDEMFQSVFSLADFRKNIK